LKPVSVNSLTHQGATFESISLLKQIYSELTQAKYAAGTLLPMVLHLKELLNCQNVTVYCFDKKYSEVQGPHRDLCFVQQMLFDSRWIWRIGISSTDVVDPSFVRVEDLLSKTRINKDQFVILPIHDKDGKLVAAIQI